MEFLTQYVLCEFAKKNIAYAFKYTPEKRNIKITFIILQLKRCTAGKNCRQFNYGWIEAWASTPKIRTIEQESDFGEFSNFL